MFTQRYQGVRRIFLWGLLLLTVALPACQQIQPEDVVIYTSRKKTVIDPILQRFASETGISVSVQYGNAKQLATTIRAEGEQTDADLFWAHDLSAIDTLQQDSLLTPLPDSLLEQVASAFQGEDGTWVATSIRARMLIYAPSRADSGKSLPSSVIGLADSTYAGRVGWVPEDESYQFFVAALNQQAGRDSTQAWLQAMKEQGAKRYPSDIALIQALADGEVDYGLVNTPSFQRAKARQDTLAIEQAFFADSDPGNLISMAGVALLKSGDQQERALHFIDYLLSRKMQQRVIGNSYEYPVRSSALSDTVGVSLSRLFSRAPTVRSGQLNNLEEARAMLRELNLI